MLLHAHSMFNIIDFKTHYKADFILMKEEDYGIQYISFGGKQSK